MNSDVRAAARAGGSRRPAVAGTFYPSDPSDLRTTVEFLIAHAAGTGPAPKGLIVPHAGYLYSGPVAACAYATLTPRRVRIRRVVLLGPAHRVYVHGLALPAAATFETPLGLVEIDRAWVNRLAGLPQVSILDAAHALEHSLEVQLPFLQVALSGFKLVPLVVGDAASDSVAEVLETLWGDEETLIVVSSDLSHYHDYETAHRLDGATCRAIEELRQEAIGPEEACGCMPLGGLLTLARRRRLNVQLLDLRNSGDTAGPRDRVVGYGAFAVHETGSAGTA
ncbi:MAG: AmmeMemoRadiSam system protein B [Gammaproteobacteria bacterium]